MGLLCCSVVIVQAGLFIITYCVETLETDGSVRGVLYRQHHLTAQSCGRYTALHTGLIWVVTSSDQRIR